MKRRGSSGSEKWGTSATSKPPPPSCLTKRKKTRKGKEPRRQGVSTCWPPRATSAAGNLGPSPPTCGADWAADGIYEDYDQQRQHGGGPSVGGVRQADGAGRDEVQDDITVPTAATATAVLVVRRGRR